jgi:hypothetical protein
MVEGTTTVMWSSSAEGCTACGVWPRQSSAMTEQCYGRGGCYVCSWDAAQCYRDGVSLLWGNACAVVECVYRSHHIYKQPIIQATRSVGNFFP